MGKNIIKNNKYLSIVPFHKLFNWSVQYLTSTKIGFTAAYPMARIGDLLKRNRTLITIYDNEEYVRVRLKTHNGGVERREKKNILGKDIGTKKQYVISEGQFIISKIDARNGAMGIVPKELGGAIVTQDFLPYDINTDRINPNYLVLVSTTKPFLEFCQSCSSGTTNRQRINEREFLDIKIPVPSLEEQNKIVSAYIKNIHKASEIEQEICNIENDINGYLINVLGINIKGRKKEQKMLYKYLKFVRLKDIQRWDVYNEVTMNQSEFYANTKLSNLILSKPQYGAAYSSTAYDNKIRYIRITDINENGTLNDHKVSAKGYSEQYLLKEDDFLIARSGNTVGKTFLYKSEYGKAIFAGYLIRFELDQSQVIPEYLLAYTKCSAFKNWIKGNMRVSAQPNINSLQYLDSPIVLPPLNTQREIVLYLDEKKKSINQKQEEAKRLRLQAINDFETKIYM